MIYRLCFLLVLVSCSKKLPVTYTKEELLDMCRAADPGCTLVLPRNLDEGVHCDDYSEGCHSGHLVKAKDLPFIAVEFFTPEDAYRSAQKIHGYYIRNWVFDDVKGEPQLERFVKETFKASRYDEKVQGE